MSKWEDNNKIQLKFIEQLLCTRHYTSILHTSFQLNNSHNNPKGHEVNIIITCQVLRSKSWSQSGVFSLLHSISINRQIILALSSKNRSKPVLTISTFTILIPPICLDHCKSLLTSTLGPQSHLLSTSCQSNHSKNISQVVSLSCSKLSNNCLSCTE